VSDVWQMAGVGLGFRTLPLHLHDFWPKVRVCANPGSRGLVPAPKFATRPHDYLTPWRLDRQVILMAP